MHRVPHKNFSILFCVFSFNYETLYDSKFGLRVYLRKELKILLTTAVVLKLGHFGKQITDEWKGLKCGAGEGSVGRAKNVEVLHGVKEEKSLTYGKKEGRLTGLDTCCIGTAF